MTLKSGAKVATAADWRERRDEIKEDFDREVLGRVPANIPKVQWKVLGVDHETIGFKPVTATQKNNQKPKPKKTQKNKNQKTKKTPDNAPGPVPTLIMFSYC